MFLKFEKKKKKSGNPPTLNTQKLSIIYIKYLPSMSDFGPFCLTARHFRDTSLPTIGKLENAPNMSLNTEQLKIHVPCVHQVHVHVLTTEAHILVRFALRPVIFKM